MMDETYRGSDYDRNEMFAIGAAAGALVATAIQEVLDRRRKTTPLERASARVSGIADEGSKYARDLKESAGEYIADLSKIGRKKSKQGRKTARKRGKQAREQQGVLKGLATGALSAVAASNAADRARRGTPTGWLNGKSSKSSKKGAGWFSAASESVQEYAATAREAIQDAKPGKKSGGWWSAASETAQEYAEAAKDAVSNGKVADYIPGRSSSSHSFLETLGRSISDYLESARETVADVDLGGKARGAAETARERIEDAKIGEKARTYAATASETLRDAAGTARERIEDAQIGETVREYGSKASQAAKVSAVKLSEGAVELAESTTEGAKDLRKGVKKRVKKTRRRVSWGLRAFIIGLAVGLLSAPQSGQRTRDSIQTFVESLLDIILPEDQGGQSQAR